LRARQGSNKMLPALKVLVGDPRGELTANGPNLFFTVRLHRACPEVGRRAKRTFSVADSSKEDGGTLSYVSTFFLEAKDGAT